METKQITPEDQARTARRAKVATLKAKGLTLQAISDQLKTEGEEHAAVTTVWEDLESQEVKVFVNELTRLQLRDIDLIPNPYHRVRTRQEFLKWFSPPVQHIESKSLEVKVDAKAVDLIREYDRIFYPNRQASKEPKTVVGDEKQT